MISAVLVTGIIIGFFVILDGLYVVAFPPPGDEVQGYAIILIGVFLLFATFRLDKIQE